MLPVGSDTPVRSDLLAVTALALLAIAFNFEMVLMDAVPVARDIQVFFIPHRYIVWESLQSLDIPLWTPLVRWGYPVLANFQSAVFYPLQWLFAVFPFLATFNLLIVLHIFMAGGFMYLLCRELNFVPPAAWVGAVVFMFGGYIVSLTNLVNHLQAAAWTPAMVWASVRHIRVWRGRSLAAMTVVYLLGFLAGAPQTFLLGALTAFGFALVWTLGNVENGKDGGMRVIASTAVVAAAVAGLAMIQILPTLEMIQHSNREAGLPFGEAARFSLDPVRLVHLLLPNDFADPEYRFGGKLQLTNRWPWLFTIYLGIAPLLTVWFSRRQNKRRVEIGFWMTLGVCGLILALGQHTPVYRWLFHNLPGFSSFRFPEKFFFFTGMSAAVLAAYGADAFLRRPRLDRADRVFFAAVLTIGLVAKLVWIFAPDRIHGLLRTLSPDADALDHFGFVYTEMGSNLDTVLAVAVAAVVVLEARSRRLLGRAAFLPLLCVIVTLDLWLPHRNLNPVVDPSFYTREPTIARDLPLADVRRRYRYRTLPFDQNVGRFYTFPKLSVEAAKWYWQQTMHPNTGVLRDVLAHDSEDAIHLNLVRRHDELLVNLPPARRHRLLRLGSVKYVFSTEPTLPLAVSQRTKLDTVPGYLYELDDPLPRAYVAEGEVFQHELDALNAILHPETDFRNRAALLPPGTEISNLAPHSAVPDSAVGGREASGAATRRSDGGPLRVDEASDSAGSPGGTARIVADTGEKIEIRVEGVESSSHLVLTDTYYPGWHAYVDGEERPVYRANYFFRAVELEPADRTVVFRYRSEPLEDGAWMSLVTLLLCLGGGSLTAVRGSW